VGTGDGMLIAERYQLGPSLGRGGMGEVFQATDEQLGRPVAVKLLLPSDRDARAGERFQREARAAARLSDPHVVSVYDFGHHGDGFFLVMELVEGRTVAAELVRSGPMPKERAIDIVEQAAAGLAAAHREDVVHRDVKPANLLVTADGTVKVADFGIAHLPDDGTTTLTATGQIVGSTHYLAPERARGAQAGKAADVYGLGCVLYQLVTGQPPFTADHPAAILYQHVDTAPAPPSLTRPELGGPFESVLLRMLAKDAAVRPSAAEIAGGALRAQPDLGPVVATISVPAAAADGDPVVTAEQPIAPEPPPRRKALLVGGIAVLATGAAVLAGVVLNHDGPRLPPTTDVGPGPGSHATTPRPAATKTAAAGATSAGSPTSARPTRRTSGQPTPSAPSSGASSPATSSPSTSAPSSAAPSSTTPSASASATQTASPSSTPSSNSPASSPSPASPSPSPQRTESPAAAD